MFELEKKTTFRSTFLPKQLNVLTNFFVNTAKNVFYALVGCILLAALLFIAFKILDTITLPR